MSSTIDPTMLHELQKDAASEITPIDKLDRLRAEVATFARLGKEIEATEELLERLKETRQKLARKTLPDMFDECRMDRMGLHDAEVDVVLKSYYYANISKDWPEEKREDGFAAVEELGGADIIRTTLNIIFGPGEIEKAREVMEFLRQQNWFGNRHIEVAKGIPWNTLTSFVREQVEAGAIVPLERLGATVGRECKVEKRRASKKGKK